MLVGFGERGVLPRLTDGVANLGLGRVRGIRIAQASAVDEAHAHPARLGERETLDLAAERARLRLAGLFRIRLDRLAVAGGGHGDASQIQQISHPCLRP